MTLDGVTSQLKTLIATELDVPLDASQIDTCASFFEGGLGIDSIAVVQLISLVEERFGIEFLDEELVPDTFRSVSVLAGVVKAKVDARAG